MPSPVTAARTIHLRRPPRVVRSGERFVPATSLDRIDLRWRELVAENPRYHDGDILHVLNTVRDGHGGVTIHVVPTSYRFYAVQRPDPAGRSIDCGVRPIGAKAITSVGEGFVMGRRSQDVAFYPGAWEFLPGGGLEVEDDGASCVLRELGEETGFEAASPPIAIALLYDPVALSWEIVHRLSARRRADGRDADHAWEHSDRRLVALGAWPEPLAEVARRMVSLIR